MKEIEFKTHWESLSPEEKKGLAESAQTSVAYLSQIANQHRGAGFRTINKLIQADPTLGYDSFIPRAIEASK